MEVTPKPDRGRSVYSSPCSSAESSPCKQETQLSSSLRERLKRSRRSFTSPSSVAKRLCVDEEEDDGRHVSAAPPHTVPNPPLIMPSVSRNINEDPSGCDGAITEPTRSPTGDVTQQRDRLRKEVKDKMETLRRLKMVKMYRSKNDLTQLQTLINKWRSCAQAALYELQSVVPKDGRKAGLSELIDLFGLDDAILHFDRTEEDFTTE